MGIADYECWHQHAGPERFLLSTTHWADTTALAAALCTMKIYRSEPMIEHLYRQGERLHGECAKRQRCTASPAS
jgi:glutamate-1-semialdehyde 2,1-aminomutase